ncbi:type II secretion system F family protein [Phenylobacterium deserti]|uniref:Type II secretion system F family protein n=1 Tax=Phenylobacterium deserti TaxID=1914756 RepID=A0A328ARI0_9CAUL|nr:type II secretion system F family protein [Phenylobacterium deserti]RAK56915.1 type II secretion system F family protein [Phenylobacterium deserti]
MSPQQLQSFITLIGVALVVAAGGGALWIWFGELRLRAVRRTRLQGGPGALAATPKSGGGLAAQALNTVRRLGQQDAVRDPAKLTVLRSKLMQAGYYNREAPVIYLGVRAAALALATVVVILTLPLIVGGKAGPTGILLACVVSGIAMLGPDQVLKSRRQKREYEYSDGFPDMLDLLVASVEAGLSLDAAVTRVTDELARRYPHLAIHLRFLVLELRAGRSRKDAWASFADRLGIDDARALATMLRQAEEMGTSLGETLSVFSADMRAKRMLRAEEKALALAAKLTLPLILFIFPCLLGALMLPAAARLMKIFAAS